MRLRTSSGRLGLIPLVLQWIYLQLVTEANYFQAGRDRFYLVWVLLFEPLFIIHAITLQET